MSQEGWIGDLLLMPQKQKQMLMIANDRIYSMDLLWEKRYVVSVNTVQYSRVTKCHLGSNVPEEQNHDTVI